MFRFLRSILIIGLALSACSNPEPAGDQESEAGLVRAADRALLEAETRRDLDGAMALFAEGAIIQPPDAPPAIGREAVRAFYADWFALPYTGIYPDSNRVVLSAGSDLAFLIGNSHIEMDASAGGGRLDGKYISLWRKVDGQWLCVGVSWSGNAPAPLTAADFQVGGLTSDSDSIAVRAALGVPDSVVVYDNPYDPGGTFPTFFHDDVIVMFGYGGTPLGYTLVGPGVRTARGLRVGDGIEMVRRLYGEPDFTLDDVWQFHDPEDMEGLHIVEFTFRRGRVHEIYVGWIVD